MRFVLVEFDEHWDSTDGICRLLSGSEHTLSIITDKYIFDSIFPYDHNKGFQFFVKPERMRRGQFIISHSETFKNADAIFINTVHEKLHDFLSIECNGKIILRVHNIHKHFQPIRHIKIPFGIFYWRKALGYFLREIIIGNYLINLRRLNQKINYYTFLSESMTQYALSEKMTEPERTMFPVPLLTWEEKVHVKSRDSIQISIVGAIEKRKKDFGHVLSALEILFTTTRRFKKPVTLNLLGRSDNAYGRMIVEKMQMINHPDFHFNSYEKNVPVTEFDKILSGTHIIVSPIRVKNITQIYQEIYGRSKFTASIGTIMQFHAVGIFPIDFQFDEDFEEHLIKYKNHKELSQVLDTLINNEELIEHKIADLKTFLRKKYNKEIILNHFLNHIQGA